jgi:hypothetical protein
VNRDTGRNNVSFILAVTDGEDGSWRWVCCLPTHTFESSQRMMATASLSVLRVKGRAYPSFPVGLRKALSQSKCEAVIIDHVGNSYRYGRVDKYGVYAVHEMQRRDCGYEVVRSERVYEKGGSASLYKCPVGMVGLETENWLGMAAIVW